RHLLHFPQRYPQCTTAYLQQNYRSTPEILDLSNRVIAHNPEQFEKTLLPTKPSGEQPVVALCRDAKREAEFVAQRIVELHEQGVSYQEIAVLYRIHSHALELQLALQQHHIPFVVHSGTRFLEQAHVKDLLCFLRVLQNPQDRIAWQRLLLILSGMGTKTAETLLQVLADAEFQWKALSEHPLCKKLSKKARAATLRLCSMLEEAAARNQEGDVDAAICVFFEQEYCDYLQHSYDNAAQRADDLRHVQKLAAESPSVQQFLDDIVFSSNSAVRPEEASQAAVTLSTVHQAKGLEWDHVFVLNLVEGAFPFFRSLQERDGEAEERRLFYVASTRARQTLTLSFRMLMLQHGRFRRGKLSRFLWESVSPQGQEVPVVQKTLEQWMAWAEQAKTLEVWQIEPGV
ncbi:MAG: ATP-dependent helicase, partial [Myxococcota bacterium]